MIAGMTNSVRVMRRQPLRRKDRGLALGVHSQRIMYDNLLETVRQMGCDDETYFGSAHGQSISRRRAHVEVRRHDGNVEDFESDLGVRDSYDAQVVLAWLGH